MLAGVSVHYYTRLERGNLSGVSESVLEALARALQLDEAERAHLFDLARAAQPATPARRRPSKGTDPAERAAHARRDHRSAGGRAERPPGHPGTNALGRGLYSELYVDPVRPVNHARFVFLDPRAHDFYVDWERAANDTVAILRYGGRPRSLRPRPVGPRRRAVDPKRGVPHAVGRAQRPHPPHRRQDVPPPGGRRPQPDLRDDGAVRRHAVSPSSPTPPSPARSPPRGSNLLASWAATIDQEERAPATQGP